MGLRLIMAANALRQQRNPRSRKIKMSRFLRSYTFVADSAEQKHYSGKC
jgi:hypothetical protein